jgi:adenosylmethionine-8-amino-7-oxononanoate aminotransferase
LRAPYEPWLGQTVRTAPVYEYRCPLPTHPVGCGLAHAAALEALFEREDPSTIAAFIAEPIGGATLASAAPPEDYWPAVADVCERNGVLIIADEVMTGFGRTGTWFACDRWSVRPDILVAGKGTASGYWPLGLCVAAGHVFDSVSQTGFVHGFTYSHHPAGAAAGRAVLELLVGEDLVGASAARGAQLLEALTDRLAQSPYVGDVRGTGLLVGIEFVGDRRRREPFDRSIRFTEHLTAAAKHLGLLLYPSTGCADGSLGDAVLLGPPFVISDQEIEMVADRTALALERTVKRLGL